MVSLKLLGPADDCIPATVRRLSTRKAIAVLGYLAMRGPEAVRRSDLASLLWGDVPARQARHSLRQSVLEVRAALAPRRDLLTTDREMVRLDVTRMRVDARSMEWLLKRGTSASVRRACSLYRGEFLSGLRVPEPAFEQWLHNERARLTALAWAAFRLRLEELMATGATDEASAVALRMMRIDRFSETPRAALLTICAERGEFKAACRHYEAFSRLLLRSFGIHPPMPLQQIFHRCADRCGWGAEPDNRERRCEPRHPSGDLLRDEHG